MLKLVTTAVLTATALAAPAGALAVVPPDTRYAGGDVVDKPSATEFTAGRAGDVLVALRTIGTSRVQATVSVINACGRSRGRVIGSGRGPVAPDGTFNVRETIRIGSGRTRLIDRVSISGRIDGNRATGQVVSSTTRRGRRVCRGTATFTSVTPVRLGTNPAPAPGGAVLRGGLAARSFVPYEVALRVAPDGASVTRFATVTPWRCGSRRSAQPFFERGAAVGPDGRFRIVNPYEIRFSRTEVERGRIVITGRFVEGGAAGTVEAMSRTTRRGRPAVRCRSGLQTWTAVP